MLEAVRFINCQSFEDVTLKFATDKVNILIADNSTGKSILFKMLKVTANPDYFTVKQRNLLIRRGADSASMICAFSDGSIGITSIFPNKVLYRYKTADASDYEIYDYPPEELLRQLGLIVDQRTKFIANIVDTDQDMLLVNSDQKGNHELLSLLATNSNIIELQDKLSRNIMGFKSYVKELSLKERNLKQTLDTMQYQDLDTLSSQYNGSQFLYNALLKIADIQDNLDLVEKSCADIHSYSEMIKNIDCIILLRGILQEIETINYEEIIDISVSSVIDKVINIFTTLNSIEIFQPIDFNTDIINVITNLQKNLENITIISECVNPEDVEILMNLLKSRDELDKLANSINDLREITEECNILKNNIALNGKSVQCPIHGEVIYDGETCIPHNI